MGLEIREKVSRKERKWNKQKRYIHTDRHFIIIYIYIITISITTIIILIIKPPQYTIYRVTEIQTTDPHEVFLKLLATVSSAIGKGPPPSPSPLKIGPQKMSGPQTEAGGHFFDTHRYIDRFFVTHIDRYTPPLYISSSSSSWFIMWWSILAVGWAAWVILSWASELHIYTPLQHHDHQ